MRILFAEVRKNLTIRFFLILILAIFVNFFLFRHKVSENYVFWTAEAYSAAQADLIAISPEQRQDYLQERFSQIDACQRWEKYDSRLQNGLANPDQIDAQMQKYQQDYESGAYLKYTDNTFAEMMLLRNLSDDLGQISNYSNTLEMAIAQAKLYTSVSIFSQPGTFAYENQLATKDQCESLLHIQPIYDVSEGVLQFQTAPATDLIGLLLTIFLCTQMIISECQNGMQPILRTTLKGRFPLILSKVSATFLLSLLIAVTLWVSNMAYSAAVFGLGDLSRPLQSLAGYGMCALEISVGEYLLLFFLLKWLLYALVGIFCLMVGVIWKNAMPVWLTVGGFLGVEYILSQEITSISAWNYCKYINVGNMIFSTEWMSEYRNLNFFGHPVQVFSLSWMVLGVLLLGMILLVCLLFCRHQHSGMPRLPLQLRWPQWLPRPGKSVHLGSHEGWKLVAECNAWILIALFVLVNCQQPRVLARSTEELHYQSYMSTLAGPLTPEKEAYLAQEEARFAELHRQISQLPQDYQTDQLEQALQGEKVLKERVYPQVERIKALEQAGNTAWLVYEPGYEYLLGVSSVHDKAGCATIALAGIILCISNLYPLEVTSGVQPLLVIYRKGRRSTALCKLGVAILCAIILYLIAQIPDYLYVLKNFGFPLLEAPVCSLEAFSGWGDSIPLWGGILICEALRLFATLVAAIVVVLISLWTGNQIVTLSISTGVLLMPLLLHLLDITFLDRVSFVLPVTGTELLCSVNKLDVAVLYYGIVMLIGSGGVLSILRYTHNGYRFFNLRSDRDNRE